MTTTRRWKGAGGGGEHNQADVTFAQGMIRHHQQAIEMSDLALQKAVRPEVKDLAQRIKQAQQPEIDRMKGRLSQWGEEVEGASTAATTGIPRGCCRRRSWLAWNRPAG